MAFFILLAAAAASGDEYETRRYKSRYSPYEFEYTVRRRPSYREHNSPYGHKYEAEPYHAETAYPKPPHYVEPKPVPPVYRPKPVYSSEPAPYLEPEPVYRAEPAPYVEPKPPHYAPTPVIPYPAPKPHVKPPHRAAPYHAKPEPYHPAPKTKPVPYHAKPEPYHTAPKLKPAPLVPKPKPYAVPKFKPVPAVPYIKPKPVPAPPVYVEPVHHTVLVKERLVQRPNGRGGHVIGHTARYVTKIPNRIRVQSPS